MAINWTLPIPESGMDAFLKQLQQGTVNRQKQQELEQTGQYQRGMIDIHQKAEDRAQQELPFLIQAHKDLHGKNATETDKQRMLNGLLKKELAKMGFGGVPSNSGNYNSPSSNKNLSQQNASKVNISVPNEPLKYGESDMPGTQPINAPNSPYKKLESQGLITDQNNQQSMPNTQPEMTSQQAQPQQQNATQLDLQESANEQTAVNPAVAALIKHETGLDLMAQTPLQKALTTEDAKQVGEWGKSISAAHEVKDNLDQIQDVITDPNMETMKTNPQYFGKDVNWYKRFGTKEQQALIGNLVASNKNMYTAMAAKFKGQFRTGEQSLVSDMLINEKDTVPVMIGKMNAMKSANELMLKRLSIADFMVRNKGKSPAQALELADQLVDGKKIRADIKAQIKGQQETRKLKPIPGKTWMKFPTGEQFAIDNADVAQAMSPANKGTIIKLEGSNG
jgi:hypothetical protein